MLVFLFLPSNPFVTVIVDRNEAKDNLSRKLFMDKDMSANQYNLAKRYIGFLHFLVGYHLSVYVKQAIYRLTDISF